MTKVSIDALAREQLKAAALAPSRRAAETVVGGHEKVLRQTVVALLAGVQIGERENHDEATVYVMSGRVELESGGVSWRARTGNILVVPDGRHRLVALEDSTLLITIAKRP
ncbi:MAG TPA: LuxR family transcriptional regulator [Actinomycetaceae bacterium]|nr:LuxR family transcriptional regulator [Actinomycetaceae bacterium]